MVKLNEAFRPSDVPEDDRNFDPIPAGSYRLQIIESTVGPTKSETGEILTLTLEVIDGPYANRKIWDRLNISNPSAQAQNIAHQNLKKLCTLLGIDDLSDTEELHFKPFTARVTVQQDKTGQYGPQNRINYPTQGTAAPASKGAPQPQQSAGAKPQPRGTPQKPWANKRAGDVPF